MIQHRIPRGSGRGFAFTLLETLFMLTVVAVFTLLLAGVTKPLWYVEPTVEPKPQVKASPESQVKPN